MFHQCKLKLADVCVSKLMKTAKTNTQWNLQLFKISRPQIQDNRKLTMYFTPTFDFMYWNSVANVVAVRGWLMWWEFMTGVWGWSIWEVLAWDEVMKVVPHDDTGIVAFYVCLLCLTTWCPLPCYDAAGRPSARCLHHETSLLKTSLFIWGR